MRSLLRPVRYAAAMAAITLLAAAGQALAAGGALSAAGGVMSAAGSCTPLPSLDKSTNAGNSSDAGSPATLAPITVFAAASLDTPFTMMGREWAAQHPGATLTFSFDGSSALRAQIEQGAPADVFASADVANPLALINECLAPPPISVFASNRLVIVVPTANPAGIVSPADLAGPGVRIVAAGEDVPITRYAEQVIANLAAAPGAPAGYGDAVHGNIVSREDNVAAVFAKVQLGEGDAGLVYASDAASSTGVSVIPIPDEVNILARYGAVELAGTPQAATSDAFLAYLMGSEAQAILTESGFLPAQ